jgi:hypothetical protein
LKTNAHNNSKHCATCLADKKKRRAHREAKAEAKSAKRAGIKAAAAVVSAVAAGGGVNSDESELETDY